MFAQSVACLWISAALPSFWGFEGNRTSGDDTATSACELIDTFESGSGVLDLGSHSMIGPNGLAHPLIWARGMYPKAPSRFGWRVAVDKVRNLQYTP